MDEDDLLSYYSRRAKEYEKVYEKPERQADLHRLHQWIVGELRHQEVLEVACGTGYWTSRIARAATAITAFDASEEVLELARRKEYPPNRVHFHVADAVSLTDIHGKFGAVFVGFWFSHLKRQDQQSWLARLHTLLRPGGKVVIVDNRFVAGSSSPIARSDIEGNTYQVRKLADGSSFEVIKNFPTAHELRTLLNRWSQDPGIKEFEYYWGVSYAVNEAT
jgi:ubiquinone/menaquinone biosynthesis C-methylase UbiE